MKTIAIGLETEKSNQLASRLNELLANYQVFYINVRGFHWNITGEKFFELHAKFEELYNDALLKIDEIAERIRTLEETPIHSFSGFLKHSSIREVTSVSDGREAAGEIVSALKVLVAKERDLLKLAEGAGDEGTMALMSDYLREQEKLLWMYSAYLK